MPRGDWHGYGAAVGGVVAAILLVFWLALPPHDGGHAGKHDARRPVSNAAPPVTIRAPNPVEVAQSAEYQRPCGQGDDNRNSDLCAQWKAAEGASEAAYWARWQVWLALAGTIGLFVTIYYTRKALLLAVESAADADAALSIATRNADAAQQQVEVSRQVAYDEIRPWVKLRTLGESLRFLHSGEAAASLQFELENVGASPAVGLKYCCCGYLVPGLVEDAPIRTNLAWASLQTRYPGDKEAFSVTDQIRPDRIDAAYAEAAALNAIPTLVFDITIRYGSHVEGRIHETAARFLMFGPASAPQDWLRGTPGASGSFIMMRKVESDKLS